MRKNYDAPSLPEHCYTVLPSSGQLIEVRRGEKGYYPCAYSTGDRAYNKVLADYFNAHERLICEILMALEQNTVSMDMEYDDCQKAMGGDLSKAAKKEWYLRHKDRGMEP